MNQYFVYILFSKIINQTYVGYTTNLAQRLQDHKNRPTKTTLRANDWVLVWYCVFSSQEKAENFERYLKTHSGRILMRKRLLGDLMETNVSKLELSSSSPYSPE